MGKLNNCLGDNYRGMNVWAQWSRYTTRPAMYEALAEECSELAHAALKTARLMRGENPTPIKKVEAIKQVEEEFTDVISCAIALDLNINVEQSVAKFERMKQRYNEFYSACQEN